MGLLLKERIGSRKEQFLSFKSTPQWKGQYVQLRFSLEGYPLLLTGAKQHKAINMHIWENTVYSLYHMLQQTIWNRFFFFFPSKKISLDISFGWFTLTAKTFFFSEKKKKNKNNLLQILLGSRVKIKLFLRRKVVMHYLFDHYVQDCLYRTQDTDYLYRT